MNREYHRWHSPRLGHDMELLVFGHSGARFLVFPTRCGRFHDYEDWGIVNSLRHKIENGWVQLFCLDSVDAQSFYCDWCPPWDRIHRHRQYEAYILHEVLPFTLTRNRNPALIAHGCSMGAYHAVNIAFRHPHLFCRVVAFSGRYDLTSRMGGFRDLFDGYYSEEVYYNTPSHFVPNIVVPELQRQVRQLEVVLSVGEADSFLECNRALTGILHKKGIPASLHVWEGEAHRARFWRDMAAHYL